MEEERETVLTQYYTPTPLVKELKVKVQNKNWEIEWEDFSSGFRDSVIGVSVSTPELVTGSLLSKHVVYCVRTEPMNYVVRRQYNDFAWLRDVLTATYEGLVIPSGPATTMFTSNAVNTGGNSSLAAFLSVQNDKEFKALTNAPVAHMWEARVGNEGVAASLRLVDNTEMNPVETDQLIADFKRQLDVLHGTLRQLDHECRVAGGRQPLLQTPRALWRA
ncbi:hypothetical protein B484DRAFT_439492 [Ochromonadaceae sp. CCMP2298]|nr:hypothetical protein B484DRAFT_439492 [Ochromonadaceae sp. CCMP2298]